MLKPLIFVITAENHPDLLGRTVTLFHRLVIPIHALTMRRSSDDSNMRIKVEVLASPEQSDRIVANLAKLIHVLWVETRQSETEAQRAMKYALVRT